MKAPQPIRKKKAACLALLLVILIAMPGCFGGIGNVSPMGNFGHSKHYRTHKDDLNTFFGPHTVIDEHTTTSQRNGYILTFQETAHFLTIEYQDVRTGETHQFEHACTGGDSLASLSASLQSHLKERLEPFLGVWDESFPEDQRGRAFYYMSYSMDFPNEYQRGTNTVPQRLIDGGVKFYEFDHTLLNDLDFSLNLKASYVVKEGDAPFGTPDEFIAQCEKNFNWMAQASGLKCSMSVEASERGEDLSYKIKGAMSLDPDTGEYVFHADEDTRQAQE